MVRSRANNWVWEDSTCRDGGATGSVGGEEVGGGDVSGGVEELGGPSFVPVASSGEQARASSSHMGVSRRIEPNGIVRAAASCACPYKRRTPP